MTSSTTLVSSRIPPELIDIIINDAIVANTTCMSTVALVARRLRHCVNIYRFRIIDLFLNGTPTTRMNTLAGLLTDVWPCYESPTQYVRSFTLMLGPSTPRGRLYPDTPIRSNLIATIIKIMFKIKRHDTKADATFSFLFGTNQAREYQKKGPVWGLSFTDLDAHVISALMDVIHESQVTSIRLANIWNVPSILLPANIVELDLFNVHFSLEDTSLDRPYPSLPKLTKLRVESSPSFLSGLIGPQVEFPPVSVLLLRLDKESEFQALGRLGKHVKTLELDLSMDLNVPPSPTNYDQFTTLQSLRLSYHTMITKGPFIPSNVDDEDMELQPIFLSIYNMLPTKLPPQLHIDIEAEVAYCESPVNKYDGLEECYDRLYHPSIEDHLRLNHQEEDGGQVVISLQILIQYSGIDEELPEGLKGEYEEYMRGLLISLDEIIGVTLDIHIDIHTM